MTTMTPAPAPLMSWPLALAIALPAGVLLGLALAYAGWRAARQREETPDAP